MIEKAINKILSLGGYKEVTINGRTYSSGPSGIIALEPPKAETLKINTLTGIFDYVPDVKKQMIQVASNKSVYVLDADFSDAWLNRSVYLEAVHESPVFKFGDFMDVEIFIIAMQALFVQDETTALILKLIGNVKDEGVSNYNDDGITQQVTAKTGISLVAKVPVPNPVTLRPYRTFMEVEQPASTFIFRIKGGQGEAPRCALFEADGRMWRLEAIKNIKAWLADKIPSIKIIA
ncbi:MAG: hypothetical protein CVU71_03860 [Deltaproteobacteria bacterium HGW-Deltaproteobacteria-6]|jgi:hypothetical protein|nr:MAG: hypothetical protein CVU71_03860 [Deltaproteobacteria bacterium HGW-Deltaproteobacteria-6]